MRIGSESEPKRSVSSRFLLRSRKQRNGLLRRRRRREIQIRERGQDHPLLRNVKLLGNPTETDQNQMQQLRSPRRLHLRRWSAAHRRYRPVRIRSEPGRSSCSSVSIQNQGASDLVSDLKHLSLSFT